MADLVREILQKANYNPARKSQVLIPKLHLFNNANMIQGHGKFESQKSALGVRLHACMRKGDSLGIL